MQLCSAWFLKVAEVTSVTESMLQTAWRQSSDVLDLVHYSVSLGGLPTLGKCMEKMFAAELRVASCPAITHTHRALCQDLPHAEILRQVLTVMGDTTIKVPGCQRPALKRVRSITYTDAPPLRSRFERDGSIFSKWGRLSRELSLILKEILFRAPSHLKIDPPLGPRSGQ